MLTNDNVLKSSLTFFNNGSIVRKIQEKRFLTFLQKKINHHGTKKHC